MSDGRVRVSISLSKVEYLDLQLSSQVLGVSPTRAAYLSMIEGLPLLVKKEKTKRINLDFAIQAKQAFDDSQEIVVKRGRGRPKKAAI